MASNAYVMLTVEPIKTKDVVQRLRSLPGVMVREVFGPYDIIMELEAPTPEDLAAILRTRIRSISGVTSTITCTWFE